MYYRKYSQVHVLLYGVKFNGDIDIVQFIFTRCVVYSFSEYFFVVVSFNYNKYHNCLYEKGYLVCNLPKKSKLHIVKLHVVQKYMESPMSKLWK